MRSLWYGNQQSHPLVRDSMWRLPSLPSSDGIRRQPQRPGARHYCGEAHAEVYIGRWFDSVCAPPKPSFK
jgi:hypothetical protein